MTLRREILTRNNEVLYGFAVERANEIANLRRVLLRHGLLDEYDAQRPPSPGDLTSARVAATFAKRQEQADV